MTSLPAHWLFICISAFSPWLAACSRDFEPPRPPIALPFMVQVEGSKIQTELQVVEHREYIFSLEFKFKENDAADRARVKKLVGEDGQDKNGDPGIPTPLKLTINAIDTTGEKPILEREFSELRLRSWGGDSFDKHIAYVTLQPGRYRISALSLKGAPELVGTPVALRKVCKSQSHDGEI